MTQRALAVILLALALASAALAQWGRRPGWGPPPALDFGLAARTLQSSVDWRQREEAAGRLGSSGDMRWVPVLAAAASNDPSRRVRRAAQDAIASIREANGRPGDNIRPPWPGLPDWGGGWRPNDPNADMIDAWFQRYLGRSVDPGGLASRLTLLRQGADPQSIEADILGSGEYWQRNGSHVAGFIRGLYRDVLNRVPNARELRGWASRYDANRGNRSAVAREFLQAAQRELSGRRWP
jgi:hypothetical protein